MVNQLLYRKITWERPVYVTGRREVTTIKSSGLVLQQVKGVTH